MRTRMRTRTRIRTRMAIVERCPDSRGRELSGSDKDSPENGERVRMQPVENIATVETRRKQLLSISTKTPPGKIQRTATVS